MNIYAIRAIYKFEMARTWRTLLQSIGSPVLSTSLYFVVFGAAIGSRTRYCSRARSACESSSALAAPRTTSGAAATRQPRGDHATTRTGVRDDRCDLVAPWLVCDDPNGSRSRDSCSD